MQEIWKTIYYEGEPRIEVSNKGVARTFKGNVLRLADNGAGYLTVGVKYYKGKTVRKYIHRLVAELFIPNPENLPQVNHKDCDKSNNCVENLEWIKRSDNIKHAHHAGRMIKRTSNGQITVLTELQVVDLYTAVKRDGVGISEKARQMGIPRTTASSILNKRSRSDITDVLDREFVCQKNNQ